MSVTHARAVSSTTSKSVTPSSSLMRAHAPNQFPPPDFVFPHLFPMVFAGLLRAPAGNCSARRYLCKSFPGCLSHDPVGLWGAYACSFPHIGGLPQEPQWVGFPASVPQRDFMRGEFSRSSLFLTFRPPGLFATPVSPTAAPLRPQGSRDFYTRADHASLPLHALGMLAV